MTVSPILVLIVVCEISFWAVITVGLAVRYGMHRRTASTWILRCLPVIDVVLLMAVAADVARGTEVGQVHRLAGLYLGVTVAFGHSMVAWADAHAAHRFAGAPKPQAPTGSAAMHREARAFGRWLIAAAVALAATGLLVVTVADATQASELWGIVQPIGVVTVIWLLTGPIWEAGRRTRTA